MSKSKKRIILHAGLHKTGTTAIQEALAAAPEILQSQGWNYPVFSLGVRKRIVNHSHPLYTLFCDHPDAYLPNLTAGIDGKLARQRFAEQLEQELKSDYNLILSGEDVATLDETSLQRLANALGEHDLLVIIVVRETYSSFCSHLQHRIHRGVHGIRLEVPSLQQNCIRVARVFPNLRFLGYEQACQSPGGLFAAFMQTCGLDPTRFTFPRANISIGNHTARFLASFNEIYPLITDGKRNPGRPKFDVHKLDFDTVKFSLTEAEFAIIEKYVHAENERLSEITNLPIRLQDSPAFSDAHPFTSLLALALLEKTAIMPAALMNHGFRYIADHQLAASVWQGVRLAPPPPTRPPSWLRQFWRLGRTRG